MNARDPEKATHAARAASSRTSTNSYGDWYLAMAAYNCGPGNVQKGIERNRFTRISGSSTKRNVLPRETKKLRGLSSSALTLIAKDAGALQHPGRTGSGGPERRRENRGRAIDLRLGGGKPSTSTRETLRSPQSLSPAPYDSPTILLSNCICRRERRKNFPAEDRGYSSGQVGQLAAPIAWKPERR